MSHRHAPWCGSAAGTATGNTRDVCPLQRTIAHSRRQPGAGHFATFALGYVGLQVFTVDFVAANQHHAASWNTKVPSQLTGALIRIWPPLHLVSSVSWPPQAFAKEDWNRLVTWDVPFGRATGLIREVVTTMDDLGFRTAGLQFTTVLPGSSEYTHPT